MRFLRRYQYLLCFLGLLVLASVLVVQQFIANQCAHIKLREDFGAVIFDQCLIQRALHPRHFRLPFLSQAR